ncbi:hypothetical protein MFLAVUS_008894 [Mucor flavus]|uniref:Bromodomain-containing protein 8 n=1 Tax=Mucor flavus TaxID=439312 RepID=A0ABP9Z8I5_9FUNG
MATAEWTVLEKLLLSQAVYKYGEDNWFQIARNLKHHALLDRPSDYFNQKNCSLQYYLMVEEMNKQKRQTLSNDMPTVVRIARELYALRLEELKKAISEDEEKFLILVSEIDDIRAGKWDNQLLGLPETPLKEEEEETEAEKDELQVSNEEPAVSNEEPAVSNEEPDDELMSEEQSKLEADNLENETRNVREVTPEPVTMDTIQQLPTDLNLVQENKAEEQGNITEVTSLDNTTETTGQHLPKRSIDNDSVTEEPPLKKQRMEEVPNLPVESPSLDRRDSIQNKEYDDEGMSTDPTRTEYSTDISQGTTPADTTDMSIRDGTESVAGSESNAATPTNERKKGITMVGKDDQRHKSWQKNINLLWREIANHKNGAMFMNPIKETIAPHYYDIVKRPMDLKTIKNRIRDGLINTTTEFERDVVLMLNNSLMYNKEGTEVYQMAREMLDDAAEQIQIFKTADNDTAASSHTRAASMAAKERRKSVVAE